MDRNETSFFMTTNYFSFCFPVVFGSRISSSSRSSNTSSCSILGVLGLRGEQSFLRQPSFLNSMYRYTVQCFRLLFY